METKVKFNVLDCIEKIYKHSQDSKLREELFIVLKNDLEQLSGYLKFTKLQSLFFAVSFIKGYDEARISEVFEHLGMADYTIIRYKKDIDLLFDKNLLKKGRHFSEKRMDFTIPSAVISAISQNIRIVEEIAAELTFVDVLEHFDNISDLHDDERIGKYEMIDRTKRLLDENRDMPMVQQIFKWKLNDFERYFVLDLMYDAVHSGDNDFNTSVLQTIQDYEQNRSKSFQLLKDLLDGKTKLTTLNLVEFSKEQFRNRTNAKLSKHLAGLLKEHTDIELEYFEDENSQLINHKNISDKKLYYNPDEIPQIEMLKTTLEENKFLELQERLKEKSMPVGITALLHGVPGTGKTESVYQLAKASGRNIFKVDISATKSMWFGESQKLVKKIFTDYAEFQKTEKNCPILLFNEADAVIGKRKLAGSSTVADTENAIQNIILEEMENFNGILLATTNLVDNMDAAFERRFLFKVKFEKPGLESSAKIWQSKLPFLSEKDCSKLASYFDFSGGEMENIARKCVMTELLEGIKPDLKMIEKFCENEKWSGENSNSKTIGFSK